MICICDTIICIGIIYTSSNISTQSTVCEEGTLNRKKSTPKLKQPETHHSLLPFLSLSPPLILFLLYINLFFFELFSVDDSVFFFFTYLFPSSSFLLMIKYYLFVYFVDVNFFFFVLKPVKCHMPMRLFRQEKVL